MAPIVHDAILVTGQDLTEVQAALVHARGLSLLCSGILNSRTNRVVSFFFLIAPDGGASPGLTSYNGDSARKAWKEWVKGRKLQWVHVEHGAHPSRIVADSHGTTGSHGTADSHD